MSEQDAFAKIRWYQMRAMESPLHSQERKEWNKIVREIKEWIQSKMTPAVTVAKFIDIEEIPWV